MKIWSYPKIYNLGHPAIAPLFDDPVLVQEKVDGSQFSFAYDGERLHFRSKGTEVHPETVDGLFGPAVRYLLAQPKENFRVGVYRGEAIARPKHNTLTYGRVPEGNVVLFDVEVADQNYLAPDVVERMAGFLGLEVVPSFEVDVRSPEAIDTLLQRESFLGDTDIEGVVFKNYQRFGRDGKALMGKYVSPAFREQHTKAWKDSNPGQAGILASLASRYRTEARWAKAVQHLEERGELEQDPRDIGKLMKELHQDFDTEAREEVMEALWKWGSGDIKRGVIRGFPEWYKARLMERQFSTEREEAA